MKYCGLCGLIQSMNHRNHLEIIWLAQWNYGDYRY